MFVTKIDLYFQSKSSTFGVEIQIREVENGFPTPKVTPFGRKYLAASEVNVSADASTATSFTFESPVFCRSQREYFVCILPAGGNPDYNLWTAELGSTDVTTGASIHTNSTVGALYTSSNDRVWVPVLKEDIKLKIYRAKFNQTSANVYLRPADYEFFTVTDLKGSFLPTERVVLANTDMHLAYVPISAVTGTFANGEFVFQSNGTSNTATGYLYSANSTALKVQNTTGRFVSTNTVTGLTSAAFGTVGTVTQNVITANTSNTITVPNTSKFVANDFIYVSSNSYTASSVRQVTAVVNATALSVDHPMSFSDSDAYIGFVRGNKRPDQSGLAGAFSSMTSIAASVVDAEATIVVLGYSTANSTSNFASAAGLRLIGTVSRSSAQIQKLIDIPYGAIKENKSYVAPSGTSINWSVKGFANNASYTADTTGLSINTSVESEFNDVERLLMSRSNEFTLLPGGRTGNTSYSLVAAMTSTDDKVSPVIDMIENKSQIIYNNIFKDEVITTYVADLANTTGTFQNTESVSQTFTAVYLSSVVGTFTIGEKVYQGTNGTSNFANGTLFFANSTSIKVKSVSGTMVISPNNIIGATSGATANIVSFSNNAPTANIAMYLGQRANVSTVMLYSPTGTFEPNVAITGATSAATANVATIQIFNENSNPIGPSRYISKNIILAKGQDAEDVKVLLTAYKPPGTNIRTYVRFLNSEDSDAISTKTWSHLDLSTSNALLSSTENNNSFIELEYDLPQSNLLFSNSITTTLTSNAVLMSSTTSLANGSYLYLYDSSTNKFNVRQVHNVVNNSTVELCSRPSFASSNANLGLIPRLQSVTCAFKYMANSGIVRYVSNTDIVYDSYKAMAVKIVLTSNNRFTVPRVADMRTLALQI